MAFNIGMHRPTVPANLARSIGAVPINMQSPTFWCENGAVYLMPTVQHPNRVVGFLNFSGLTQYVHRSPALKLANTSTYDNTPFAQTDFPAIVAPDSFICNFYVTSATAPLFDLFRSTAGLTFVNKNPGPLVPIMSWADAASLKVQTPQGLQTVSVQYLPLGSVPIKDYAAENLI